MTVTNNKIQAIKRAEWQKKKMQNAEYHVVYIYTYYIKTAMLILHVIPECGSSMSEIKWFHKTLYTIVCMSACRHIDIL